MRIASLTQFVSILVVSMVSAMRTRPKALVYRGPAASEGCPEAVAHLLRKSPYKFDVEYAGPDDMNLDENSLKGVSVYAFPGGPDLEDAWDEMQEYQTIVQNFVAGGGHYLGFCLGAYLAGHTSGFGLVPNGTTVGSECEQPGAQVRNTSDTIIQVDWTFASGQTVENKWLFFQEGAFIGEFAENEGTVIARYSVSGDIAASVTRYGEGTVGLVGPHPEADKSWFSDAGIRNPDGISFEIGYDFIAATLNNKR